MGGRGSRRRLGFDQGRRNSGSRDTWRRSSRLAIGQRTFAMVDFARVLGANEATSTLLVLFTPSKDCYDPAIDSSIGSDSR
jgi:hypothetical protein